MKSTDNNSDKMIAFYGERDIPANYFKAFLVIGMLLGHAFMVIPHPTGIILEEWFITYINLITFSGFVFSFGYVFYKAYILRYETLGFRYLKSNMKSLLAFYISGIFSRMVYYPGEWLTPKALFSIVILQDIPLMSEFLAAFFVLGLLFFILFKPLKNIILPRPKAILCMVILPLLSTFFPYQIVKINQLGLLVGSYQFFAFPVIQYLSLFFIGIYFAMEKIKFKTLYFILSICATGSFFAFIFINNTVPIRFSPSLWWILGSWLFLYIYYLLADFLYQKKTTIRFLNMIGENSLFFLVVSNVILFALAKVTGSISSVGCLLIGISLIIMIYFLAGIIRNPKHSEVQSFIEK